MESKKENGDLVNDTQIDLERLLLNSPDDLSEILSMLGATNLNYPTKDVFGIRPLISVNMNDEELEEPSAKKMKLLDNCIEFTNDDEEDEKTNKKENHVDVSSDDEINDGLDDEIEPGFSYPLEMDSSDMLEEFNILYPGPYPSLTDRYFKRYYQIDVQRPYDDMCVMIHSNRICMISLAPSHFLLQGEENVETLSYKVTEKCDRTVNKTSGKAKHGAQPMQANSNLCRITTNKGTNFTIKCCMIGKLMEVNQKLIKDPTLLKEEPHDGGYIAIVLPNLKHHEKMKETLMNQEQYEEAIKKRNLAKTENKNDDTNQETEKIVSSNENRKITTVTVQIGKFDKIIKDVRGNEKIKEKNIATSCIEPVKNNENCNVVENLKEEPVNTIVEQ
ncbi:FAM206 family protein CG9288 [Trichogramma pretiosum]|uniref:FAM206 family protein CG9288 n=1 Tax=Trichogramma pretiosum TaxID=7493 RepID=UPI0006C98FC4|nr:FAM206 family protein CG9288 [Trichogramma pretiosum]XP_023318833.1 FAM206 family protein CG9288 [Trichogramma pretiosum]